MNRSTLIALAAALAATGGCVAVSTETVTRNYELAGFDSISARSGVNVVLKQGPFDVRAEGPKRKIDRLQIERQGSSLIISREPTTNVSWFSWPDRDVVTVIAPNYVSIDASGGADIDVASLKLDALDMRAAGGGDINADDLTATTLTIKAGGGGDVNAHRLSLGTLSASAGGGADINVSGACKTLTVETSGGADFRGEDLKCEAATVSASGGGDADVTATASASGRASSGGDIRFHGNPASFEKEESGGGDVSAGR